jgi:hypothetical protein
MKKSWSDKRESRWVSDLKVGDEVIIAGILWTLTKVSVVTEDFIVANGMRFYRDTGHHVPASAYVRNSIFGNSLQLIQATPERILTIKTDDMASEIEEFDGWYKATPEEIEAVFAIVKKVRERR